MVILNTFVFKTSRTGIQNKCLQLFRLLDTYLKQHTVTKNKIKGKSKKLALIAVAKKLFKESFAIVKSGRPYDETYVSILPR